MGDERDDDVLSDGTPARRYRRRSEELEFDRVAFFSDAVFAIAMTLLVVGIGIPHVSEARLGDALSGKDSEVFTSFLSFVVIGFYCCPITGSSPAADLPARVAHRQAVPPRRRRGLLVP